jgi:predicted acylesterase/phospholipase RssA
VRASAAVPIITSPVLSDGDLLVDGAFLNNLPIDIMRPLCEGGPLIVVDVSSQIDLMSCSPFGDYLSGWEVLRSKINPFSQKLNVPNMITILFRSMELQSVQRQQEIKDKADYYLRPPVETFGILDFKSFGRIAEIGYQYAEKKIEEWKGSLF